MTHPLDFLRRRNQEEKEARAGIKPAPGRCQCGQPLIYLGAILGAIKLYGCRQCHLVYWGRPR